MDIAKVKIKIGEHEFEAEGPVSTVQEQLEIFKSMISSAQAKPSSPKIQNADNSTQNQHVQVNDAHVEIGTIMHMAGRVISLTALPTSTEDAALIIMLGHKEMRNNVSVTGQEIGDGLAQSGRPVPRVDRIMEKAIDSAYVLKTGLKRGTRYRLTNQGLLKALTSAKELIASLP